MHEILDYFVRELNNVNNVIFDGPKKLYYNIIGVFF